MHTAEQRGQVIAIEDVCASFQQTAVDMLVDVAVSTVKKSGIKTVVAAGGVSANSYLRAKLKSECEVMGVEVHFPPMSLCTDNAAMVAMRAKHMIEGGLPAAGLDLNAKSYLRI
ncbi:MAG: hypothetical protein K2L88_04750 [Clostridiales bacterium]|nr:hypothetical protein [Clostridiales bacterium]